MDRYSQPFHSIQFGVDDNRAGLLVIPQGLIAHDGRYEESKLARIVYNALALGHIFGPLPRNVSHRCLNGFFATVIHRPCPPCVPSEARKPPIWLRARQSAPRANKSSASEKIFLKYFLLTDY